MQYFVTFLDSATARRALFSHAKRESQQANKFSLASLEQFSKMPLPAKYPVIVTLDERQNVLRGKWIVPAFRDLQAKQIFTEFFSHKSAPYNWSMSLHPNGDEDSPNHLGVYLFVETKYKHLWSFSLGFEDKDGKETVKDRLSCAFTSAGHGYGEHDLLSLDLIEANYVKADGSVTQGH